MSKKRQAGWYTGSSGKLEYWDGRSWSDGSEPSTPPSWHRVARIIGYLVFLVVAVPAQVAVSEAPDGQRLPIALILVNLFLVVIGSLNWLQYRLRNEPRSWLTAVFAPGPLIIVASLMLMNQVGEQAGTN